MDSWSFRLLVVRSLFVILSVRRINTGESGTSRGGRTHMMATHLYAHLTISWVDGHDQITLRQSRWCVVLHRVCVLFVRVVCGVWVDGANSSEVGCVRDGELGIGKLARWWGGRGRRRSRYQRNLPLLTKNPPSHMIYTNGFSRPSRPVSLGTHRRAKMAPRTEGK